jgi:hypothetical protein
VDAEALTLGMFDRHGRRFAHSDVGVFARECRRHGKHRPDQQSASHVLSSSGLATHFESRCYTLLKRFNSGTDTTGERNIFGTNGTRADDCTTPPLEVRRSGMSEPVASTSGGELRRIADHGSGARGYLKLVDQAQVLPLEENLVFSPQKSAALVAQDDARNELAGFDPRKAQVVELGYFGGLRVRAYPQGRACKLSAGS